MSKKIILVSTGVIAARIPGKKEGEFIDKQIEPDTTVTPAMLKEHDIDADQLAALMARGIIVEQSAHVTDGDGDGAVKAALAEATKRADEAETKVTALTNEVAEARKLLTPDQVKTLDAAIAKA